MKGVNVYMVIEEEVMGDIRIEVTENARGKIRNLIDSTVPLCCENCNTTVCFSLADLVDSIVNVIEED